MNVIEYREYESPHAGNFSTEAGLSNKGFEVRVEHAHWSSSGAALIHLTDHCLIRLLLAEAPENAPLSNRGTLSGNQGSCQPLGQTIFIPPGSDFHFKHRACQQKAVICLFDPAAIAPLAAYRWDWEHCITDAMLNLQSSYLQASLRRLGEEVASPGFASELHIECLMTGIALELRKEFLGKQRDDDEPGKLSRRQLQHLREALDADANDISLRKLADLCALPERKLSVYFKNTTGKTLRQYSAEARVNRAMRLLGDPSLLIKQIAYMTGFQSAAAFSAAFRKAVGWTPEEFRRRRSPGQHEAWPDEQDVS
ncbi:MAG: AraC family transcriptional regulator [Pseudomonas sp. BICA1-14]|nr:AraC family transcriptional regulator [[Pseudomonas] sp. BICA1-14]KJS64946.1 MAG: AraC family transcriptional regulator [[Pseudomonas] sp. BICA1-14]